MLIRIIEGVNNMDTNWILFSKRASRKNCLGKARQINADFRSDGDELWLNIQLNGVTYYGHLKKMKADEEE